MPDESRAALSGTHEREGEREEIVFPVSWLHGVGDPRRLRGSHVRSALRELRRVYRLINPGQSSRKPARRDHKPEALSAMTTSDEGFVRTIGSRSGAAPVPRVRNGSGRINGRHRASF